MHFFNYLYTFILCTLTIVLKLVLSLVFSPFVERGFAATVVSESGPVLTQQCKKHFSKGYYPFLFFLFIYWFDWNVVKDFMGIFLMISFHQSLSSTGETVSPNAAVFFPVWSQTTAVNLGFSFWFHSLTDPVTSLLVAA